MSPPPPTVEDALAEASSRAGLESFGDPWFHGPLEAWLSDLSHPRLSPMGREVLGRASTQELIKRLEVLDCLASNPGIADVELPPIVLITGYVRSGTTLLHNLMARHPRARTLRRWELVRPVPPPASASYDHDPRIARVQAAQEKLRGSLLERMHWINADDPEECTWSSYDCTGLFGRGMMFAMPEWASWLLSHDLTPHFRAYRALLQLLLWKCPAPPGGHLLLKCPQTAWNLREFAGVFPEARLVVLHRDPFRAMTSANTLLRANAEPLIKRDEQDWPAALEANLQSTKRCYRELMSFARDGVVQVAYPELMADADGTLRRIYRELDMQPYPEELSQRVRNYLEQQRAGQRLSPPATYADGGLSAEVLGTDPDIAAYCERFHIAPETRRLTDTRM